MTVTVSRTVFVIALSLALGLWLALLPSHARAAGGGEEAPSWRLEKVLPPQLPGESAEEHQSRFPIDLGKVGDIEFWAPNRGLLITDGNGETIKPGVWVYNGREWRELATECGATDGRIAWAGPEEFWTVSDGRPGQASSENVKPPLEDNTLCHFAAPHGSLEIVGSYASLAFRPESYQPMDAAACLSPGDCWFGGSLLPKTETGARTQFGAFQLHWNGGAVLEQPYPAEHAIEDLRHFGRYLYESVQIGQNDHLTESESPSDPPDLHLITPIGVQPTFVSLTPGFPQYAPEEHPAALGFLHLSADEEALWGAADPLRTPPEGSAPGEVTILRYAEGQYSQVLGYGTDPPGGNPLTQLERAEEKNETVSSIAAEPGAASAWLALTSPENESAVRTGTASAMVAQISATGQVSDRQTLPVAGEGGPKGAAQQVTCPATNDCWMVTTQGWLFHLTTAAGRAAEEANPDTDPAFSNLITFRPEDEGVPKTVPDAPPVDDSGLLGEAPLTLGSFQETPPAVVSEEKVPVALVSDLRTHLEHETTLELSFHLATKAQVRLIAKRRKRVVASTPMRTLGAGNHKLLLRLNRSEWPTKLNLQTHPLAPLPTTTVKESVGGPEHGGGGSNTISTGLHVLPGTPLFTEAGTLP
jgi:hypothetical protein